MGTSEFIQVKYFVSACFELESVDYRSLNTYVVIILRILK